MTSVLSACPASSESQAPGTPSVRQLTPAVTFSLTVRQTPTRGQPDPVCWHQNARDSVRPHPMPRRTGRHSALRLQIVLCLDAASPGHSLGERVEVQLPFH